MYYILDFDCNYLFDIPRVREFFSHPKGLASGQYKRGLRTGYKRRTVDYGLRTADCGLRTADCGLRTADCGLRTADCGLRTKE